MIISVYNWSPRIQQQRLIKLHSLLKVFFFEVLRRRNFTTASAGCFLPLLYRESLVLLTGFSRVLRINDDIIPALFWKVERGAVRALDFLPGYSQMVGDELKHLTTMVSFCLRLVSQRSIWWMQLMCVPATATISEIELYKYSLCKIEFLAYEIFLLLS